MPDESGHPQEGDVLFYWATSTDRVIAGLRKDIETLKRCVLTLFVLVCVLAFLFLAVAG